MINYPPPHPGAQPGPPQAPSKPRPMATIAAIVGVVAPVIGLMGPAICWPVPAALGAIAIGVALAAGAIEHRPGVLGLLGGVAALIVATMGYAEWQDAVDSLNRLSEFGA